MARRAWGQGSFYPRKDGRYVATLRMADGSRRTTYHRTEDEAKAELRKALRERDAGVIGPDPTLGKYLAAWLTEIRPTVAPATWKQHANIVRRHLTPALGRVRLSALTVGQVRAYLHRSSLHPQTVAHHRATLRRALADAVREGLVVRNVAALARPPSVPNRERSWLTVGQVRSLLATTDGTRWHALWALGATAGLRMAEALALVWDDVDLVDGTLAVRSTLHRIPGVRGSDGRREPGEWVLRDPKTRGSRRTVTLTPLAVTALRAHELRQAQEQIATGIRKRGLVFATSRGEPIHGPSVLPELYRALAAADLPRVTFHGLRHSAASVMLEAGVSLRVVSELLGHSTIRITADLYSHVAPTLARDAADRVQDALEG